LPQAVNPNVPEPVQRVLLKSLAKNRDDRFNTVEELIGAFKSAWLEAGIPMRGSDITMTTSPAAMPPAPALKPTRGAGQAPAVNPLKSPKKKPFSWMWAGVGLIAILCLCIAFAALRNTAKETAIAPASTPEADSPIGGASPLSPGGQNPPPPILDVTPTLIPEDQMPPEIRQAIELVRANPADPHAHLDLSLAFWDAGMELPAFDEYMRALETAQPDSPDFYVSAADAYRAHEAWHLAAGMYLRAMPLYTRGGGFIPEEVKGGFRESAYKGAKFKDLPAVASFEQMAGVQTQFANVIRGRHALYNGDLARAEESLALALPAADALPEVYLLQAEIAIRKGNIAEARETLAALAGKPNVSPWMLVMAEEILKSIQ
jgi:hypothetical protein